MSYPYYHQLLALEDHNIDQAFTIIAPFYAQETYICALMEWLMIQIVSKVPMPGSLSIQFM
jgi:hypothetical protein